MAIASDPPKDSFRLDMLIYDTRFRSITIQVVVLLLFLAGLIWLLNNAYVNLEAKGKDFNFAFLWSRAGYDLNQTLIPYTNDDTHMRAMVIGLLNTLLVSLMGCFLATILGTIVGVLRLSHNWLVARIMTVFVETFRNIPLLLWILLMGTVLAETRPGRTMSLVILPQALRVIVPPLISQFLNLTKNSSLAIAVSYMDLRGTLGGITLNQTGRELECMLLMMGIYLVISRIISSLMNIYNKSIKLKER